MRYDADLYLAVTSALYRFYGSAGAVVQLGALLTATVLTLLLRRRPGFRLTLLGTLGVALSLLLWGAWSHR